MLTYRRVYLTSFELHYDLISGCTMNFSLGVQYWYFSRLGMQLLRCTPGYGQGPRHELCAGGGGKGSGGEALWQGLGAQPRWGLWAGSSRTASVGGKGAFVNL